MIKKIVLSCKRLSTPVIAQFLTARFAHDLRTIARYIPPAPEGGVKKLSYGRLMFPLRGLGGTCPHTNPAVFLSL